MFGRIARRYDLANRLLSGGRDQGWRRRLVAAVRREQPQSVLDLATGSGDVALALAEVLPPSAAILGMDFCLPMLEEAERKRRAIWCYTSQLPPLEAEHALSPRLAANVGEQYWRLAPPPAGWERLADIP